MRVEVPSYFVSIACADIREGQTGEVAAGVMTYSDLLSEPKFKFTSKIKAKAIESIRKNQNVLVIRGLKKHYVIELLPPEIGTEHDATNDYDKIEESKRDY